MATAAARAVQRANALNRLTKMTKQLARAYGVDEPEFPLSHRDPAYLPTLQMETIADFLESLSKAGSDDGDTDAGEPMTPENTAAVSRDEHMPKTAPKRKTAKAKGA